MKKQLFALAAGLVLLCSCSDQKTPEKDSTAEKRKTANALFYKAIETGDAAPLDNVLTDDAIDQCRHVQK